MSASNGVPVPSPPQDCTLYYYMWPCGHWQWVGCTKCSLSPPTNHQAHLAHEHKQVQLPHPKHRCPMPGCGGGAAHEMEWIGIDGPNAQAAIQELTALYNSEEQIRERTESDVYAKEYPWRIDAAFADDEEGPSARNEAVMNVYRLGGRAQALESFLHTFPRRTGREQQAPGSSTSPLGSDQTTPRPHPAQPAVSMDTTPRQPAPPPQQLEEGEIDESALA